MHNAIYLAWDLVAVQSILWVLRLFCSFNLNHPPIPLEMVAWPPFLFLISSDWIEYIGSGEGLLFYCCEMLVQGDRTDKRDTSAFNTWKDIIIPGNVDDEMTKFHTSVQPLPLSERKYLANFLGRAQGKIGRLQLVKLAKQFPDKVCLLLHSCFA